VYFRYIQQLADEREKVSVKLSELQSLVVRLLQDRQYLQAFLLALLNTILANQILPNPWMVSDSARRHFYLVL